MHLTPERLLILLVVLIALGALLWIAIVSLMAWAMLHPPRMSAGKAMYHLRRLSPGDLGLRFEEENLKVQDQQTGRPLHMAGWWIPSSQPGDRCVVLIHGYADAKVGAIAWAPLLHELNLNILAIDLRAHGDSGGAQTTGGFFERQDVSQIIDQILASRPNQTRQMILFGISLGAAVAVAVAVERTDIAALVLESPFADYERAIAAHSALLGLPGGSMLRSAIGLAQMLSGASFDTIRPADLLKKVHCPVLCIVGGEDELLSESEFEALQAAVSNLPGSDFWQVENAGHLQAMQVNPTSYRARVNRFLGYINSRTDASSDRRSE
jgi:pimeloyl-ACP methyl ester carboxylesterase